MFSRRIMLKNQQRHRVREILDIDFIFLRWQ